jgi:ABC-type transporter MlaC component
MATAGSLQYLRDYGFKTFDGLIDETYDTIADPAERLQAVVNEMSRIAELDQTRKLMLWDQLYKIAEFNQQLFFSKHWQQSICEEFTSNLSRSLGILEQYTNGFVNTQLDKLWTNNPAS